LAFFFCDSCLFMSKFQPVWLYHIISI
jgi:hypothetical protein